MPPVGYGLGYLAWLRRQQQGAPASPDIPQLEPDYTSPAELRARPIPPEPEREPFAIRHPGLTGAMAALAGPETQRELVRAREGYAKRQDTSLEDVRKARERQDEQAIKLMDPSMTSNMKLADAIARARQADEDLQQKLEAAQVPGYTNVAGKLIPQRPPVAEDDLEELSPGASLIERKTGKVRATAPAKPTDAGGMTEAERAVDQMKRRDFDLKQRQIELKQKIAKGGAEGLTGPELAPLREEFKAIQKERAQGWNRINQIRGTPQPRTAPEPTGPSEEELRAIAELEASMNEQERREWAGYTDAEKLYILKELQGAR